MSPYGESDFIKTLAPGSQNFKWVNVVWNAFDAAGFRVRKMKGITSRPPSFRIITDNDEFMIEIDPNGDVYWEDFSHATKLGNAKNFKEIVRRLKQLRRLQGNEINMFVNKYGEFKEGYEPLRKMIRGIIKEALGGKPSANLKRSARAARRGSRSEKYEIVDGKTGKVIETPYTLNDKRTARKALEYVKNHHDRPNKNAEIRQIDEYAMSTGKSSAKEAIEKLRKAGWREDTPASYVGSSTKAVEFSNGMRKIRIRPDGDVSFSVYGNVNHWGNLGEYDTWEWLERWAQ